MRLNILKSYKFNLILYRFNLSYFYTLFENWLDRYLYKYI